VAEFLSTEWLAALDAAARGAPQLAACAPGAPFVLEQRVSVAGHDDDGGGDSGDDVGEDEVVYQIVLAPGGARVVSGRAGEPDLVLLTDVATAGALARGERNAQSVLAEGRLRVRGDLRALTRRAEALRAIDDVFASVRAETTYTGGADPSHR
jgi:hypothetical protein